MKTGTGRYHDNVFLNCPFDEGYQPMFIAVIFAVHDAGFTARSALEVEDSGEVRIEKIKRTIRECRHGIHDISRADLDAVTQLARFNMPLELGLFLGAQEYGGRAQKQKRSLILDVDHSAISGSARTSPGRTSRRTQPIRSARSPRYATGSPASAPTCSSPARRWCATGTPGSSVTSRSFALPCTWILTTCSSWRRER
jgi:hypothetical protein